MTHQDEAPDLPPLLAVDALMYCTPKGGGFHQALQDSKYPNGFEIKWLKLVDPGIWNTVDTHDYQLTDLT